MELREKNIFDLIIENPWAHIPDSEEYCKLKIIGETQIKPMFKSKSTLPISLEPFGSLVFPYHELGAVSTLNLFDIDELILFAFYLTKKGVYKKALDLGANVGLHSLIMSRCGYEVNSFEPDPHHFKLLTENMNLNFSQVMSRPELFEAAITISNGKVSFVRVHGNTMSSHIQGMKENAYGMLSEFEVRAIDIKDIINGVDFIKMDVEGHEGVLIKHLDKEDFSQLDIMMEIGNDKNRQMIFDVIDNLKLNCFSQKIGWRQVRSVEELPKSYKEGSVFFSGNSAPPWPN